MFGADWTNIFGAEPMPEGVVLRWRAHPAAIMETHLISAKSEHVNCISASITRFIEAISTRAGHSLNSSELKLPETVGNYKLVLLDGEKKALIGMHRDVSDSSICTEGAVAVEELFENEQRLPLLSKSFSAKNVADRPAFSNKNGSEERAKHQVVLPPGWVWQENNFVLDISPSKTDAEGWMYAADFLAPTWTNRGGFFDFQFVRRRRWFRTRVYAPPVVADGEKKARTGMHSDVSVPGTFASGKKGTDTPARKTLDDFDDGWGDAWGVDVVEKKKPAKRNSGTGEAAAKPTAGAPGKIPSAEKARGLTLDGWGDDWDDAADGKEPRPGKKIESIRVESTGRRSVQAQSSATSEKGPHARAQDPALMLEPYEVEEEVYENQQRLPLMSKSFSPSNLVDRPEYSDRDGKKETKKGSIFLTPGYRWTTEWVVDINKNTDKDGWQYSSNFACDAKWTNTQGFFDFQVLAQSFF